MFYLPMRSCWSNTIDHSTKASSERLGQESIQNGVDAGVTIGEQIGNDLKRNAGTVKRILLERPAKKSNA